MLSLNLDSFTLTALMPHVSKAYPRVNIEMSSRNSRHSRKQNGCLVISASDFVQWGLQGKDCTRANV